MPSHRLTVRLLLACALLLSAPFAATQERVYKSRDAQGNVIFSDQSPGAGAEAVTVPRTNTMREVATPPPAAAPTPDATPAAAFSGYDTLAIRTPADGTTVTNPGGFVEVGIALSPQLQPGHSLRLLLDGAPAGLPQMGSMTLEGLSQGAHTLQVQVMDAEGTVVQNSGAISVHVNRVTGRRIGPVRIP